MKSHLNVEVPSVMLGVLFLLVVLFCVGEKTNVGVFGAKIMKLTRFKKGGVVLLVLLLLLLLMMMMMMMFSSSPKRNTPHPPSKGNQVIDRCFHPQKFIDLNL